MSLINVTCTDCGPASLPAEQIVLMVNPDEVSLSFVSFTCPRCRKRMNKAANLAVLKALRGLVTYHHWHLPDPHTGLVLTEDDLIVFGQQLEALADA